ncbi:MAG: hypothetical protein IT425_08865 [Pirellulales bacterium]|nr:hypothetical protein [Pirellulales bacterium]
MLRTADDFLPRLRGTKWESRSFVLLIDLGLFKSPRSSESAGPNGPEIGVGRPPTRRLAFMGIRDRNDAFRQLPQLKGNGNGTTIQY